jgi:hypothetical protein
MLPEIRESKAQICGLAGVFDSILSENERCWLTITWMRRRSAVAGEISSGLVAS